MFGEAYKVHPYGRPVIGFSDTVRGVSRETAVKYHQRWYKPNNMVLVVAGDLDPAEMKPWIQEYFGPAQAGEVPALATPAEPAQKGSGLKYSGRTSTRPNWPWATTLRPSSPKIRRPWIYYPIYWVTGGTSRLYRHVQSDRQLVNTIDAGSYTPRDPGLLVVNAQLNPDLAESAIKAIVSEVTDLSQREVTPQELSRAKLNTAAWFIRSRDTMSGEAKTAAQFEALAGDYRAKDAYLSDLEKVTGADIKAAAAKYLSPDNLSLVLMLPKKALPDLNGGADQGGRDPGSRSGCRTCPRLPQPRWPRNSSWPEEGGSLSRLIIPCPWWPYEPLSWAGVLYENDQDSGLNNLLAEVWDRGTTRLSADELAKAVEDMAASITSFSGRNSFGLEGQFLSQYLDPGLDLLCEVLTTPSFDVKEVEKARPNILAAIKRQQDQLPSRTFRLFAKTLFKGHPYSRDILGRPDTVRKLTADELKAFYHKWAVPQNLVINRGRRR